MRGMVFGWLFEMRRRNSKSETQEILNQGVALQAVIKS